MTAFAFGAEATTFSILAVYFDKFYDISNSLAHVGLSLGIIVLPLLTQFFLDNYGWRGTILILAGLNMHIALCGALLIPIQFPSDSDHSTRTPDPKNINAKSKLKKEQFQTIKTFITIFDLDLFKNSEYISMLCAVIGNGYYYSGWLIYLIPHAEDLGFSPYAASALATAGGVGLFVGSLAFPLLAKVLSSKSMILIFHFIAFVALFADPIVSIVPIYSGLIVSAFAVNFACVVWGCAYIKESSIIVHESRRHSFLSWTYAGYGIGSVLSGFISGKSF